MRFRIDVYRQADYPEVIRLMGQAKDFVLPEQAYLRCLGLVCRDLKRNNKIVGFLTTISGLSNTAYLDYVIVDKEYRHKGLQGNRILALLHKNLEAALRTMKITAYLGHAPFDNKELRHLYEHHGAKNLGDYTLFRKEIKDENIKTSYRHPNQAIIE